MRLEILFDDRLEALADGLLGWLDAGRGPNPLSQDTVLVPDVGTGRWLARRIAMQQGVCACVRFELPGRFFWRTLRELIPQLPATSPFDPRTARWSVLQLFDELQAAPECEPLRRRVSATAIADRLALAEDIAAQFERYLALRRDWLERWQAGAWAERDAPIDAHEPWQRWLWRRLLERLPDVSRTHPFDRLEQALASPSGSGPGAIDGQRVAVFGIHAIAPEQMLMLARLATRAAVAAFVPDPCRALWSDLVDPKSLARIRTETPDLAWLYDDEPQVLGLWGRAHRDRVAQWLMLEEAAGIQSEAPFRDRAHALDALCECRAEELASVAASLAADLTRLAALHASILLRSDRPWTLVADPRGDDSVQLHATHGAMRSAEVLHDLLLECFESLPGLRPDQIVVMCADIEEAGDAIEAAFASAPSERSIPIAVSGRSARTEPMQRAAIELLEFALGGAQLPALEQWLANPVVLEALSLDAQRAGELVAACEIAGVRWGLDATDGPQKHNWRSALDRLVLGAALGGALGVLEGVAPMAGLRRVGEEPFERLLAVLDAAQALRIAAGAPVPVARWCELARGVFTGLFGGARRHADALAQVLAALDALRESAASEPASALDARAFRQALVDELDRGAGAALAAGAVTVCPIGGLRGIGFRVVVLFGLDETAYPRSAARGEFDLIARVPRFGDRIAGVDDRGIFLDALLAAGERFVVLYAGRDPRDDTARNPSTLVTELLEYVNARQPAGYPPLAPTLHPLHPFSAGAFAATHAAGPRPSYASQWLATARSLDAPLGARRAGVGPLVVQARETAARSERAPGPGAPIDRAELEALRDALANPARACLRETLGVNLPREHAGAGDVEPLAAGDLDDRALVDEIARRLTRGDAPDALLEALRASPQTPAGPAGEVHAHAVLASATALWQRAVSAAAPGTGAPVAVTAFRVGMHALVGAWLDHVAWALEHGESGGTVASHLIAADASVTVRVADPSAALEHARRGAALARAGALPLFPRTAREILANASAKKVRDTLFASDDGWTSGEIERPWFAALYRDGEPTIDAVEDAAREVYGPIVAACEIRKV